jgi:hypothetical protein
MEAKIIRVTSPGSPKKGNVVLSVNNKPINPGFPLWQQVDEGGGKASTLRPAAFLLNQPDAAVLTVTVRIRSHDGDEDFFLEGLYGSHNPRLFYGIPIEKNREKKEIVFKVTPLYIPGGFFKMSGQGLHWRISRNRTGEFKELGSVELEIYWLYGDPYDYFQKGIPVEILREIARACKFNRRIKHNQFDHENRTIKPNDLSQGVSAKEWVVEQVVKHCFNRNPPRFNIWGGQSQFTVSTGQFLKTLLINQYLNAKNDSNALCNCIDQAGVLQYYLKAIGIEEVRVYPMDRFGYLKKTQLVGWGDCNNPYFGNAAGCAEGKPVVDENCADRTFFKNHHICLIKLNNEWRVLDSCIGPHTGSEDKYQYLENARDAHKWPDRNRTMVAYVDDICPKGEKAAPRSADFVLPDEHTIALADDIILPGEPGEKGIPTPGITFAINQLPDPEDAVSFRSKGGSTPTPKGPGGTETRFLVREWPDVARLRFPAKKNWRLLFKEIVPGKDRVLKTWKLVKDKSTITINLYISNIDIQPGFISKAPLWKSPGMAGEFYGKRNQNFQIHAYFQDISDQDELFVDRLKDRLNQLINSKKHTRDMQPEDDLPAVNSITCINTLPKIGEKITVKIPLEPDVYYDFHLKGKRLRHIYEYDDKNGDAPVKYLDFIALEGVDEDSDNRLVVMAVHTKKLLLNSKAFAVKVTS